MATRARETDNLPLKMVSPYQFGTRKMSAEDAQCNRVQRRLYTLQRIQKEANPQVADVVMKATACKRWLIHMRSYLKKKPSAAPYPSYRSQYTQVKLAFGPKQQPT